jgi:hypothetical protein
VHALILEGALGLTLAIQFQYPIKRLIHLLVHRPDFVLLLVVLILHLLVILVVVIVFISYPPKAQPMFHFIWFYPICERILYALNFPSAVHNPQESNLQP